MFDEDLSEPNVYVLKMRDVGFRGNGNRHFYVRCDTGICLRDNHPYCTGQVCISTCFNIKTIVKCSDTTATLITDDALFLVIFTISYNHTGIIILVVLYDVMLRFAYILCITSHYVVPCYAKDYVV